jgi:hypothetical protein
VYIVVGMSEFRSELEIKSLENGEKWTLSRKVIWSNKTI